MAFTAQERALEQVKAKYGSSSFTEDHLNFRMVGFRRGEATVSAIGETWSEAIAILERKANGRHQASR